LSWGRLLAAAGLALLAGAGSARAELFDYLYVEANAGGASGGHVAVRFGDDVYHYQNAVDSSLRLVREPFDFFRYAYTVFQNRTIHLSRIDVDAETRARLERHFNARHLIQQEHFERLAWRRADVALLERMQAGGPAAGHDAQPALRGVRFFLSEEGARSRAEAPPLVALRARVARSHGRAFLDERLAGLARELSRLEPAPEPSDSLPLSRDRLPPARRSFAQRFAELASGRVALEVLSRARPLRPAMQRVVPGPEGSLGPTERAALAGFARKLEADLSRLVASRRPDFGYPLLLGMARLLVVDASLRSGRITVLDAFPLDAPTLPPASGAGRELFLRELGEYARDELAHSRHHVLAGDDLVERDYNELEAAANRYLEVREAREDGREVRVQRGRLVPQGELAAPARLLPTLPPAVLEAALRAARQRERQSTRALRQLYGYGLVTHNCVSELFDTINGAFEPGEVSQRLGARVEAPGGSPRLIPFVAFGAVTREYRISGVGEIPSYRRARLAEMYARENPIRVYLREANTLTSTVYRRNPADSFFLFFTDDTVLPRPLFGALNLLAGMGEALVGLATWPFDGGHALRSGATGALYSLPELGFFNIRKGTLEYARSQAQRTGLRLAQPPD
jgi:hypothetical protein